MWSKEINRRDFIKTGAAGAALVNALSSTPAGSADNKELRLGFIGTGSRGRSLMHTLLAIPGVRFPALCDINLENLQQAQAIVEKKGQPKPEGYYRDEEAFQQLLYREDLDAVVIATPWDWHARMAVQSMRCGKYTAVEVPAALSIQECWDLVNTFEETQVPCMMLENWSFRRDNLAVLNMIRKGLLGEIVYCHAAHSHDCVDHWFFTPEGQMRWGGRFLLDYNRDQYPTHSMGPVFGWMDLGYGDYFDTISSVATRSLGVNAYFKRKFGPDHPNARLTYRQGDIVTSTVKTKKGNTLIINYDMQLPRPYDNRWTIQGTEGIYNEQRDSVYLTRVSPKYHEWEPFPPYQDHYDHVWWRTHGEKALQAGHSGTDYMELLLFLDAVRKKSAPPISIYDSVLMSVVIPLSGLSIEKGGTPIECPDFTRGQWKTNRPAFALES